MYIGPFMIKTIIQDVPRVKLIIWSNNEEKVTVLSNKLIEII